MRIECVSKWHKNHCKGSCSFGVWAKTNFLPKWLAIIEGYRKTVVWVNAEEIQSYLQNVFIYI